MNSGGPQKISICSALEHGEVHLSHPASEEELGGEGGQEWTDGWTDRDSAVALRFMGV